MKRRSSVREWAPYLLMAILVVVFFLPFLWEGNIFCFRDIPRYFYPFKQWAAAELQAGRLPLWCPQVFAGMPFLAALQTMVLHPLSLVTGLLPEPRSFNWFILAHFFIGGWGMVLLLRDWPVRLSAAMVGACAFVFGGFFVSVIDMTSTLSSVAWMPLVLFFFRRVLGTRPWIFLPPAALMLALLFMGGEPTVLFEAFLLLAGLILFRPVSPVRPLCLRGDAVLRLGLLLILAVLAVLPQLLPFLELLQRSGRAGGTSYANALAWSMPPRHLLTTLFPFLFGKLSDPFHYQGPQLWLNSVYLGLLPIFFAAAAWFRPVKRDAVWLWATALLGIVLALGVYTPVYPWLYHNILPFQMIRYPVKFLFLAAFSLSVLAGLGWDRLAASVRRPALFGATAVLLLFLDLFLAHGRMSMTARPEFYTRPPETVSLMTKEGRVLLTPDAWEKGHVIFGRTYEEALDSAKESLLPNFAAVHGVSFLDGYDSLFREDMDRFLAGLSPDRDGPALNAAYVRYVVSAKPFKGKQFRLRSSRPLFLYENTTVWPEAYVVDRFTGKEDRVRELWKVLSGENERLRPDSVSFASAAGDRAVAPSAVPVKIMVRDPCAREYEAVFSRPGLLATADADYPGWRVWVDGRPAWMIRVNDVFRGVFVGTPGAHRIRMSFEPPLFYGGMAASLLFLLAALWKGAKRIM